MSKLVESNEPQLNYDEKLWLLKNKIKKLTSKIEANSENRKRTNEWFAQVLVGDLKNGKITPEEAFALFKNSSRE